MPFTLALALALALISAPTAQQPAAYDYWGPQREMIDRGQQAIFMCNGLFTSGRTLEQVFAQELKYLRTPIGTADGGDYEVDRARRAVSVGKAGAVPVMRAAFRDGIGCVILSPDQTLDDLSALPSLDMAPPPGDAATMPWPDGDLVTEAALPSNIDAVALQAASDWAFMRPSPEQDTLSLLVVHKGQIIHERYAQGVTMTTRTRTWSTAKSIAATLIGILVDQGKMSLDAPLGFEPAPAHARVRAGSTRRHHAAARAQHVERPRNGRQQRARVCDRLRPCLLGGGKLGRRREEPRADPRAGHELGLRELRHAARGLRDEARAR